MIGIVRDYIHVFLHPFQHRFPRPSGESASKNEVVWIRLMDRLPADAEVFSRDSFEKGVFIFSPSAFGIGQRAEGIAPNDSASIFQA